MAEQGSFIWYELSTTDPKGAIAFYKDVVGWSTDTFEGAEPPYWVWLAGAAGIGGVTGLNNTKAAPSWVGYVYAEDVDALTKQAASLGAKVCAGPFDIPRVGRFSSIADPQGAVLSMITPTGPDRPTPTGPTPGHVVWHELLTNDTDAALKFYGDLLGWQKTQSMDMGDMGQYEIYGKSGRDYGGMMKRPAGYPLPPHFLYYVHVSDLDAATERVKGAGGKIWNGPMPIPSGERVVQCADPQGATFALHGS